MEPVSNWVVKIRTQQEFDKVLEKLHYPENISSKNFEILYGEEWQGIDYLLEYSYGSYYERDSRFIIVSFDDFMNYELPNTRPKFNMHGEWVVQCHTQQEWNDVLKRHNPLELSEDSFEDFHDDGFGVDMEGYESSIEYYMKEYSSYRIIPAAEFLSITGPIKDAYSIF